MKGGTSKATPKPTTSTPPPPASIGDFSVLPISLPPTKAYTRQAIHHIYVRRNSPRNPTADDARSLFLANIPVDSTEAHLRSVFVALAGAGKFEAVTFEDERRSRGKDGTLRSAMLPAQAARLLAARKQLQQSRKRKRDDNDDDSDGDDEEAAEEREAARMLETWPRRLHRSGSTAVVLLADEKSASLVLKAIAKLHKTRKYPVWGAGVEEGKEQVQRSLMETSDNPHPLGVPWLRGHNRLSYPSKELVKSAIDSFFAVFNRREREAAELAKRLRSEPDDDGFVTVTRGSGAGRAGAVRRDEAEETRRKMEEKLERKKAGMSNFYRFQLREQKKAEQAELVKRFDEDRKKVEAMKEKRGKFRPET